MKCNFTVNVYYCLLPWTTPRDEGYPRGRVRCRVPTERMVTCKRPRMTKTAVAVAAAAVRDSKIAV